MRNKKVHDGNVGKEAYRKPKKNGLPNGVTEVVTFRNGILYHYYIAQINDKPGHAMRLSFRYYPDVPGSKEKALKKARQQRAKWVKKYYNNQKSNAALKTTYVPMVTIVQRPKSKSGIKLLELESRIISDKQAQEQAKLSTDLHLAKLQEALAPLGVSSSAWLMLRAIWIVEHEKGGKWALEHEVAELAHMSISEVRILTPLYTDYISSKGVLRNLTPVGNKLVKRGMRLVAKISVDKL